MERCGSEALAHLARPLLLAFGLCLAGRGTAATAQQPPARDTGALDRLLVTDTVYQGWKYFQVYCARCHGENARGNPLSNAADLTYSVSADGGVSPDSFRVVVRQGSANKDMKGFADLLSDEQIQQLHAYLKARSEGRLAPGRPHRAPAAP